MKKWIAMLLLLALMAGMYGCAAQPEATEPSTTAPTQTTQPPTDAPTEPPTEPPAVPPTEPPTEPPLDENRIVQCYLLTEVKQYRKDGTVQDTYQYDFDDHGRIIYSCHEDDSIYTVNSEETYVYDTNGRLICEDQFIKYTYTYTDEGRVAVCTAYRNDGVNIFRFTYDAEGRITELGMEVSYIDFKGKIVCRYDDKGRLVEIVNGTAYQAFSYDAQNRVIQYAEYFDGELDSAYLYEYDQADRLIRMVNKEYEGRENFDADWNCTYDENGKLTAIDAPDYVIDAPEYSIDKNGNIEKVQRENGSWIEFKYEMIEVTAKEAAAMPVYWDIFGDIPSAKDYVNHIEDWFLPRIPYLFYVSTK